MLFSSSAFLDAKTIKNKTQRVACFFQNNFAKVLAVLVFGGMVNVGWGQTASITITNSSIGGSGVLGSNNYASGAERTWTQSSVGFGGKAITCNPTNIPVGSTACQYIQAQAANGVIYNKTALPGRLISVQFVGSAVVASSLYGGTTTLVNSSTANYTVGGTLIGLAQTSSGYTWTTGAADNYTYFCLKRGTTAQYFSSIIITYATAATPTISSSGTLSALSTTYGTASSNTSFSVSGANMTAGISINPPVGFQVSTLSDFSSNVGSNGSPIIIGAAGTIASTTVYVRLAATTAQGTFSGNIILSSSSATDVNVATVSSIVSKKALTISGLTGVDKEYDATTTATFTGTASYVGLENGETFTVAIPSSATFNTATAGTNKPITVSVIASPSVNYTVTQPSLTAAITQKSLTITADNVNKAYGNTLTGASGSTAFTSSGLIGVQTIGTVTIAYGSGAATSDAVGTYIGSVTPSSATGGTFSAGNYAITYASGDIIISATPTLSAVLLNSALTSTYGGTPSVNGSFSAIGTNLLSDITATAQTGYEVSTDNTTFSASVSVVTGTTVYVRFIATQNAGTYNSAFAVELTSSGATNVNITTSASGNILSSKELTITGLTGENKEYDATTAATFTGTASYVGLVNGETFSVSGPSSATFNNATFGISKPITVNVISAPSANYTVTQPLLSADITKKSLTVSGASAANKVYNGTTVATISGGALVGVISPQVVTLTQAGNFVSANVGAGISITGNFLISGAAASNYTLVQPLGLSANITQASQTITFNALLQQLLGVADYTPGATATSNLTVTYTSSNPAVASIVGGLIHLVGAGTTTITASQAGNGNYAAASDVSQTLNVITDNVLLTAICTETTENFNSLANSGTSTNLPSGWYLSETGTNTNSIYTAGTGSGNSGDTYSLGLASNVDRVLGGLRSGSLIPTFGAKITNNTGETVQSLLISYVGETWRVGSTNRTDQIDFSYSTNATLLSNGTWLNANNLDYANPGQATGSGSMQHSAIISDTLTGLTIANGASIWIRWTDFNASGANDAMGIDDFSVKAITPTPTIAASGSTTFCAGNSVVLTSSSASGNVWSTGETTQAITVATSGNYSVHVNCSATSSLTTVQVISPSISATPTSGDLIWHGSSNSDFGTISNWYEYDGTTYINASVAPSGTSTIIIPANQAVCVLQQPSTLANSGSARNITIESGASLTMQNGVMTVAGNWENKGTFVPGTGTVEFNGASDQTISNTAGETFNKLTINKGSGVVLLSNNVTISNQLNLTSGIIDLQASNLNMASNTVNGGSATSYVKTSGAGELKRNLAVGATTLFPIGRSTYNPAELVKSGSSHSFGVRVTDAVTANGLDNGAVSTGKNMKRMWHITPAAGYTAGNGAVSVSLIYEDNASNFLNGFSNNAADRQMFHFGGTWENITSGTFVTGDYAVSNYFYCTQPGVTNFSPFTISNFGTALPIELISFQANCAGDKQVDVTWSTASEHNTSHFVVEKTRDGVNWVNLKSLDAAGNSTTIIQYALTDTDVANGTSYYRLTQFDTDGASETFNIASVNCGEQATKTKLVTYPNPSNGSFYIDFYSHDLTGPSSISVSDSRGLIIYRQDVIVEKGSNVFNIEKMDAAPGMYYIQVSNGTTTSYIVKHSLR